ncbi:MAG: tyrosine-type recombinase/integrase, partial [Ktedonobacteraceae bacterium]|nr:tyrosine-type recombinase/integrase [Ktedonobacteraceae bacterium]
ITLPRRTREGITRARTVAARNHRFQAAHWQPLYDFVRATGLRRRELTRLRVGDIFHDHQGQLVVQVQCGKGGKQREAPVLPGYEPQILALIEGRPPEALVFPRLPGRRLHDLRRDYAQSLYLCSAALASPSHRAELPPVTGRLKRADYDLTAVQQVSWALGHNRIDVIFKHYLRS